MPAHVLRHRRVSTDDQAERTARSTEQDRAGCPGHRKGAGTSRAPRDWREKSRTAQRAVTTDDHSPALDDGDVAALVGAVDGIPVVPQHVEVVRRRVAVVVVLADADDADRRRDRRHQVVVEVGAAVVRGLDHLETALRRGPSTGSRRMRRSRSWAASRSTSPSSSASTVPVRTARTTLALLGTDPSAMRRARAPDGRGDLTDGEPVAGVQHGRPGCRVRAPRGRPGRPTRPARGPGRRAAGRPRGRRRRR